MSGGASLLFVIALGLGGVSILYVVYHINSIAHSVTDTRAQVRREMLAREEKLRDSVRSGLEQHAEWARAEFREAVEQAKSELAAEQAAMHRDTSLALERLAGDVAALRARVDALGAPSVQPSAAEPARDAKGRQQGTA